MKYKLEPIGKVLENLELKPKKSFGQNFIFDLNLTEKITRSAGKLESFDVLEIGPGVGSLTRSILNLGARKVVVIEKDKRLIPALNELKSFYPKK